MPALLHGPGCWYDGGLHPPPIRATVGDRAYLYLRAMAKKLGRANDEYLCLHTLEGFLLRLAALASS